MRPIGGTELLYNNLLKHTGSAWQHRINLMVSACRPEFIDVDRTNVVWQHLAHDQSAIVGMAYPREFINRIDHFVYVSDWQLGEFQKRFAIKHSSNRVIRNAIEPIQYVQKPRDRIRLIYTSMPNRGLEILLNAIDIMDRKDIELVVYSSDIIYGSSYARTVNHEQLFYRCKKTPNVVYRGYAMNQAVRKALQSAHILAYPSVYEETSCLAAIEAGAAGCRIVTTNLGALPETCGSWAAMTDYQYGDDLKKLSQQYAEVLNTEIDNYSDAQAESQSQWFNHRYSWFNRAQEWKEFFDQI